MTDRRTHVLAGLAAVAFISVPTAAHAAPAQAAASAQDGRPAEVAVTEVAHRGSSAEAPENTLAAVQEGIADRADYVEIDVQRSADGELVVIHDVDLTRTTDVEQVFPDRSSYQVGDFTLAELKQLDAGSWKSAEFAGERIPTLQEVLDVLRPSASGLLLEMKSPALYPGISEDLVAALQAQPGYLPSTTANGRLVVQSFDWEFMATFNQQLPQVTAGLLGEPTDAQMEEFSSWADQINPHHSVATPEFVDRVHELGMETLVYTVNDPARMETLVDNGVDGIITDEPDVLDEVLRGL